MIALEIANALIAETVACLRASSTRERVILWLGRRHGNAIRIHEVYLPIQEAEADYFRIPRNGMEAILAHVRPRRLLVAAQVHTHPAEAFHSLADDRWAIVRHQGALSLVVPCFCRTTTASTFVQDALVYQLNEDDRFTRVASSTVYRVIDAYGP